MLDQHFLSVVASGDVPPAAVADVFGALHGGERVMWRGCAGVAEYAFEQRASLPRWTLPESTGILVTDRRVMYAHTVSDSPDDLQVTSGELRWLWPQHLRVQPGSRKAGRAAAATQVQLVCGGSDGSWPAVVFAGGDLVTVADADRLGNVIRQAIARFRIDHADKLRLTIPQSRLLSRLLIGPEFSNCQGGPGQTVSLPGALLASRPARRTEAPPHSAREHPAAPEVALPAEPAPVAGPAAAVAAALVGESRTRVIHPRPGIAADMARALQAAKAEAAAQQAQPRLASRAADLAARVADLVARSAALDDGPVTSAPAGPNPAGPALTGPALTRPALTRPALTRPQPAGPDPIEPDPTAPALTGSPSARPAAPTPPAAPAVPPAWAAPASSATPDGATPASRPVSIPRQRTERTPTARVDIRPASRFEESTTDLAERAEKVRRAAGRFTANSAQSRVGVRRAPDRDLGATAHDNRHP
jgi:hypothetical protein